MVIEPAATLRNSEPWSTTLVGGVGQYIDPGGVQRLDQTVLTGGAHVVPRAGRRGPEKGDAPASGSNTSRSTAKPSAALEAD